MTWLTGSRMKLRSTREVYWLAASASATTVIENTTPATVAIDPAMAVSMLRAPSASTSNTSGHHWRSCSS